MSLPAWECGLKSTVAEPYLTAITVTPCVGVWIEIGFEHDDVDYRIASLPAWECGLK